MGTEAKRVEVTAVERIAASEGTIALALGGIRVGGSPGGIAARVEIAEADGSTIRLGVSRLHGESEWIVDSYALDNGYVLFSNGVGSRCTKLKAVRDEAIIRALTDAAFAAS